MEKNKLDIQKGAEGDIQDAFEWYEDQREGLGVEFVGEMEAELESITENPEHHPVQENGSRRAVMKRFPYIIYYVFVAPFVRIIQVFHTSQNPAKRR